MASRSPGPVTDGQPSPCGASSASPFHIGIASPDIEPLMASVGPVLGLTWVAVPRPPILHQTPSGPVSPSSQVAMSRQGPLHVELLKADPGTVYRPERGTHIHHVGYWTDDFVGSVRQLEKRGWVVEVTIPDEEGRPATFAYLSRASEVWIELVDLARRPDLERLLAGAC